jgi:excinuclease ABC subunit C
MLDDVAAKREKASEAMDFEGAAALHKQWEKVKAAAGLADELVRPVAELRAVVLQEAAPRADGEKLEEAAAFLLERGRIVGPERLSTLGVRAVREQTAVGSSLFAQPLMLAAVPEQGLGVRDQGLEDVESRSAMSPEDRARDVLQKLAARADDEGEAEISERCDFLSLFRRWYYRPEKQRAGEVFLPNADAAWPVRRILNGAARVMLGAPGVIDTVDREAAKEKLKGLKTKVIHAGREGVEREVPVLPKRSKSRKAVTPGDLAE